MGSPGGILRFVERGARSAARDEIRLSIPALWGHGMFRSVVVMDFARTCALPLVICLSADWPLHLPAQPLQVDVARIDHDRILKAGQKYLHEPPLTITAYPSPRSAGGPHEYFSEGDYWWPDPENPDGPYIQRDGMSNPDNFVAHRQALIRLSVIVPALASAYQITHKGKYAAQAAKHLKAWFLDEKTRMYPHLKYAQAIKGRVTGRGTGIIDTLHLVEVAVAIPALERSRALRTAEWQGIKTWFREYLEWMTTHPYGIEERDARNNHATCWILQVAAFAQLVGDQEKLDHCRKRFKEILLPGQLAADGSFPEELRRTKPYGYSLFNLEAMAGICQLLSTTQDDLWNYQLDDGRCMRKAMEFMFPFIADKSRWPHLPDVAYFECWPVRQASLLFAGMAFKEPKYIQLWRELDADPTQAEVIRNFPIRQPSLWVRYFVAAAPPHAPSSCTWTETWPST
jgi:hypothetical protein